MNGGHMKAIASMGVLVILTILLGLVPAPIRSVQGQERQAAIDPLHFHHVHLNSVNPSAAAAYYPKAFATSSTKTTFNGYEAVKTGNVYVLFTKVNTPPRTS